MDGFERLDNPAWHALNSVHGGLGVVAGRAARYRAELSPIGGLRDYTADGFTDLRPLVPEGDVVGLVSATEYAVPPDWELMQTIEVLQMVCPGAVVAPDIAPVRLATADVPEMVDLATATEPGPFRAGTIGMGRYYGLRSPDGRLMAMAGERMLLDGLAEVSAVCTWPEFRGRGLARALVQAVAGQMIAEGRVPFLHVKVENAGAIRLYEKLGFVGRRRLAFRVMRPV